MSEAILGIGIPGSGKTTYLKVYAAEVGLEYVSSDETRALYTGSAADVSKDEEVWPIIYKKIASSVAKGGVVVDATSTHYRKRLEMIEHLRASGATSVTGFWLYCSLETALRRNQQRDRVVPPYVIRSMYSDLRVNPPAIEDGFDELLIVGTEDR